ncbi:MAG: YjbH domain-containing protein [Rhodobacteraceae bacterium]|nr:YjbH domain-containing protein [Paracoccaceae bacterium]
MSVIGRLIATTLLAAGLVPAANAQGFGASFGSNGSVGIIDMPNAVMQPDGQTSWSFIGNGTMGGATFNFQLLPWIEASTRSVSLADWTAPGDGFGDTALDLKFQLLSEGNMRPAVALGFRDFMSNGPTTSEYLVASKSFGSNLRVTGGLGWGRLGTFNSIGQVLGPRPAMDNGVGFEHLFTGDAAFFAGVEWQTPMKNLTFKAEYSSDDYAGELAFGDFERNSPFNFGLEYRLGNNISMGAYYNYGSDFGFRVTLTGNPNVPITPQDIGTGPAPINARPADASRDTAWAANPAVQSAMVKALADALANDGIQVKEGRIDGSVLELYIANTKYSRSPMAVGRLARILAGSAPASVEVFRITLMAGALPTTTMEIHRSDLEAQVDRPDAGMRSFETTQFSDASFNIAGDTVWTPDVYPRFSWSLNPRMPVNLFSAGGVGQIDFLIVGNANYQISRGFGLNLAVSQRLGGNIGEGAGPSTSPIPHVRSDAALYNNSGPVVTRLTADYLFKVNPAVYGRVSAGYLERMFGGISGELLWKPTNQSWGTGVELSYAKQRAFDSMFGFQGYETVTGFASVYWNTGFQGLEAQLDVGRYLAGDWGATFSLSRQFTNGWEVAGFFTLTDVSFADFGTGNFSKGVSLTIPFAWTLPFESRSSITVDLAGYGNDGGARLNVANRLYPVIRGNSVIDLNESWGAFWQ